MLNASTGKLMRDVRADAQLDGIGKAEVSYGGIGHRHAESRAERPIEAGLR